MPRKKVKKNERNTFREVSCIIAFDQSYNDTGIAICVKGKVKKAYGLTYKDCIGNTAKRQKTAKYVRKAIEACLKKFDKEEIVVLTERVRTFTSSDSIRIEVIKTQACLVACIVDAAMEYGIKTYSVDTRCWKSKVLGSSRPVFEPIEGVKDPQKFGSVRKAISLGFEECMKITSMKQRNSYRYDDNIADAICMSLYPFTGYPYLLNLEK